MTKNKVAAAATRARPWQVVVALIGATAGFGVFLIGLGAAVMWVRLDSAGLPAEQGVSVVSKQTLAIVGAHVLLEPLALGLTFLVIAAYFVWRFLGTPRIFARHDDSLIVAGRREGLHGGTRSLRALGLPVLLACLVMPVSWVGITTLLGFIAGLATIYEGRRLAGVYRDRAFQLFVVSSIVALALITIPSSLVSQAESRSRLQRATLLLGDATMRSGYFVAETSTAVYLGANGAMTVYPRERVRTVTVRDPSPSSHASPAAVLLWNAVFN